MDNNDYNKNYDSGWRNDGAPSNGNALDAWSAGHLARQNFETSRAAMDAAHRPVEFTSSTSTAAAPAYYGGTYGGGVGGGFRGYAGTADGGGNLLLVLTLAGVYGTSMGFLVAAAAVIGSLVGAFVAALLIWPLSRLLASSPARFGKAYAAALSSICLYAGVTYLLMRFGGRVLTPLDARLQVWLTGHDWVNPLHLQTRVLAFVILTQIPSLLLATLILYWRLGSCLRGLRGLLLAAAFSVATAVVLIFGVAELKVHSPLNTAAATQRAAAAYRVR
jgi:hypothetical protein